MRRRHAVVSLSRNRGNERRRASTPTQPFQEPRPSAPADKRVRELPLPGRGVRRVLVARAHVVSACGIEAQGDATQLHVVGDQHQDRGALADLEEREGTGDGAADAVVRGGETWVLLGHPQELAVLALQQEVRHARRMSVPV